MDTPESRADHRAASVRRLDKAWIAVIAGVAALALVLTMVVVTRLSSDEAAGAPPVQEEDAVAVSAPAEDDADDADAAPSPEPEPEPLPTASGDLPAVEAPTGRGMLHVPPVAVDIPAIGVTSTLVDLGLNPDNSLEVPSDYAKAGWYTEGSFPGDAGGPPALIVGHVDDSSGPAVFYELNQLEVGDEIKVERSDGSTAVFVVYDAQQHPKDSLPTEEIYSERDGSELVLITCTGDFDPEAGSYLDNYVVTARLDPELSGLGA